MWCLSFCIWTGFLTWWSPARSSLWWMLWFWFFSVDWNSTVYMCHVFSVLLVVIGAIPFLNSCEYCNYPHDAKCSVWDADTEAFRGYTQESCHWTICYHRNLRGHFHSDWTALYPSMVITSIETEPLYTHQRGSRTPLLHPPQTLLSLIALITAILLGAG